MRTKGVILVSSFLLHAPALSMPLCPKGDMIRFEFAAETTNVPISLPSDILTYRDISAGSEVEHFTITFSVNSYFTDRSLQKASGIVGGDAAMVSVQKLPDNSGLIPKFIDVHFRSHDPRRPVRMGVVRSGLKTPVDGHRLNSRIIYTDEDGSVLIRCTDMWQNGSGICTQHVHGKHLSALINYDQEFLSQWKQFEIAFDDFEYCVLQH